MKIAYLIMVHKSPEILKRLVHSLDATNCDIFIHVDARCNIEQFKIEQYKLKYSKLVLTPKRHAVYWGHISITDAMLELYKCALEKDDYYRFVMLSGEDYPIKSNSEIYKFLTENKTELLYVSKLVSTILVTDYWFWKLNDPKKITLARKVCRALRISKPTYIKVNGEKWEIYKSATWHALTKECVQDILEITEKYPQIYRYYKYSRASDESFFATIIYNLPKYRDRIYFVNAPEKDHFNKRAVLHYLNFKREPGTTVEIFDEYAYESAIASDKLFIRKVRAGISDKLLEMLDEYRRE